MRIPRAKGTPPNMNGPYAHRGPPANSVLASVMCVLQPFLAGDGVPPTTNMRTYHRPIASQVCTHRPRIVVSCDRTLRTAHCKVQGALIHHSLARKISMYILCSDGPKADAPHDGSSVFPPNGPARNGGPQASR